ncbi:MAG: hypothetical protein Q9165_004102 [Trypethelium subeluteriae]
MSDSSSLSSPPSSDDEASMTMEVDAGPKGATADSSDEARKSSKRKRSASPPHEEVLADNADIPLNLLKTLILWSLNSSEAVSALLKESYKYRKNNDDSAVPLNIPRWGRDGEKRQYWLIEGQQDTSFRVYRESNPYSKKNTWWSVAGDLDELRGLANKLENDDSQYARQLGVRFKSSIPRFEAGEEKRKRREYRQQRKAQFLRPEPGFSLYEGRTRGKRLKYTYSDDEADASDATSTRRSTRVTTPADAHKPVVTASGRQVRSRLGGVYGETMHSGQITNQPTPASGDFDGSELSDGQQQQGRTTRSGGPQQANGWGKGRKHIAGYNELDEMDDEEDAMSSGGEWDGGDDDDVDDRLDDNEEDDDDSSDEDNFEPRSLVVKLQYRSSLGHSKLEANGQPPTHSSTRPDGTSVTSTVNGHYPTVSDDQDSDTIVVRMQRPPPTATQAIEQVASKTKPTTNPTSESSNLVASRTTAQQQMTPLPAGGTLGTNSSDKAEVKSSFGETRTPRVQDAQQDTVETSEDQAASENTATAPVALMPTASVL